MYNSPISYTMPPVFHRFFPGNPEKKNRRASPSGKARRFGTVVTGQYTTTAVPTLQISKISFAAS